MRNTLSIVHLTKKSNVLMLKQAASIYVVMSYLIKIFFPLWHCIPMLVLYFIKKFSCLHLLCPLHPNMGVCIILMTTYMSLLLLLILYWSMKLHEIIPLKSLTKMMQIWLILQISNMPKMASDRGWFNCTFWCWLGSCFVGSQGGFSRPLLDGRPAHLHGTMWCRRSIPN
jgi:hypothetical protein